MVSALNYMSLFLGVEILSISMYVLAGANRRSILSNEASLKYFITGSFTSAIMLFGIAWIYAESGSLSMIQTSGVATSMMSFGFIFLFTAFALKVALVPFHFGHPMFTRERLLYLQPLWQPSLKLQPSALFIDWYN